MPLLHWYNLNFVKLFSRRCPELNIRLSNDKLGDAISHSHSRRQNIHWNVDIDFDNYNDFNNYIDFNVDSDNFYIDVDNENETKKYYKENKNDTNYKINFSKDDFNINNFNDNDKSRMVQDSIGSEERCWRMDRFLAVTNWVAARSEKGYCMSIHF